MNKGDVKISEGKHEIELLFRGNVNAMNVNKSF